MGGFYCNFQVRARTDPALGEWAPGKCPCGQTKDIGSIKVGDVVEIAFDAFPENDFGRLKAKVVKILEPDSLENPNAPAARSIRAQAQLSLQTIRGKTQDHQLLNGMTLRARLANKKESLFMSFLKSIFKFKDEIKS